MEVHTGGNSAPRISGKHKAIEKPQRLFKTSNSKVLKSIS